MFRAFIVSVLLVAGAVNAQDTGDSSADTAGAPAQASFVNIETSLGSFVIELMPDKAPKSVANFLTYVNDGFYDGTIFHRIIGSFVIQGGGFTPDFTKKATRAPITNEADNMVSNGFATLAMARTADPHSATSQFYINVADNIALNHTGKTNSRAWGYAVFARVVSGMEVIEAIRTVPTGAGGPFPRDVPQSPVTLIKATTVTAPPAAGAAETASSAEG
ncbi:MAG: peptidylprolyl isomerase [Lysobacterales bacterium]